MPSTPRGKGRGKAEFEKKAKCEHPERLKGKLGDCSQEQIRQCHGEGREHPCLEKK